MLYTILVLISGVYLGQEYSMIPSIRMLTLYVLNYVNSISNKQSENNDIQDDIQNDVPNDSNYTTIYQFILRKLKLS